MQFTVLQSVYSKDNPDFLNESLQSIADSTMLPQRLVLVKDGSLTPELEAVINHWHEFLPLLVVGYEKNQGLAHALNYGLQFVETELVARMDSDDICYPERFHTQVMHFEMDKNLSVLGSGIEEFYKDSNTGLVYRQIRLYPKKTTFSSISLYRGTPIAHPSVMMKTQVIKKFCYSESTHCNEDIDLWFRLLQAGEEIRTLQIPLLHFRITDGTFKRRSLSKSFDEFLIYKRFLLKVHGINRYFILLMLRLCTRIVPARITKKLYLSTARKKLFKENVMKIKSIHGHVFIKAGHLFEALVEFEEDGVPMIKAVQLDCEQEFNNTVEVPLSEITLYRLKDSTEFQLSI